MVDANIHIVIDNGSGFIKAGFSGEESPRHLFPTITGHTKVDGVYVSEEKKESIVGTEAQQKFGILNIKYPIQQGIITDWDEMLKIWHHCLFCELKIAPEEHNILLTDSPCNSRENREKMTEIMFESLNVPSLYISAQSVLAAYSVGKSTCMMIDCGEGSTNFAPIYEGLLCKQSVLSIPISGKMIFERLVKMLMENGQNLDSKMKREGCKLLKEKMCYIKNDYSNYNNNYGSGSGSDNYNSDNNNNNNEDVKNENSDNNDVESEYTLPDGSVIKINKEKYQCTEILFNPSLYGYDCKSLQDKFMDTIKITDSDMREDMFANILFNGGTSLFKGFKDRVYNEIKKVSEEYDCKKKVHVYPEAQYMAWIGGSILTNMGTFENIWVTKSEYKEFGSTVIHRKCF